MVSKTADASCRVHRPESPPRIDLLRLTARTVLLLAAGAALAACGGGGDASSGSTTPPASTGPTTPLVWDTPSATWDNVKWQ